MKVKKATAEKNPPVSTSQNINIRYLPTEIFKESSIFSKVEDDSCVSNSPTLELEFVDSRN